MKDNRKTPDNGKHIEDFVDDVDLPPITDDEVDVPSPETLSDYLDEISDGVAEQVDDASDVSGGLEYVEKELASLEEGSWLEDVAVGYPTEAEVDVEEVLESWSEEGAVHDMTLENDWFVEADDQIPDSDGGEEGPLVEDSIEIDRSGWEDLDGWDDQEDEPVEQAMERLGISIGEEEEIRGSDSAAFHRGVEFQFLGPLDGTAVSLSAQGENLVAVGDGVYLMGADGLMHNILTTPEITGTSATGYREMTFIGTRRHGVMVMVGTDPRLRSLNDWYSLDMDEPLKAGTIETAFTVMGQRFEGGFRLLGADGSGRLFESRNAGTTWRGPLPRGRCVGITAVGDTDDVAGIFIEDGTPGLAMSRDLDTWTSVPIPSRLRELLADGRSSIAAATGTIAVAPLRSDAGIFITLDGGESWREAGVVLGGTAVAVDPQDPSWLAVAGRDPSTGNCAVRVSGDGGFLWNTALVLDEDHGEDLEVGRIVWQLALVPGKSRTLYVVETGGIHQISMSTAHTSH